MPTHCFVVMSDPVRGLEDEYDDWYSNRHLADVLALEGFKSSAAIAEDRITWWFSAVSDRRTAA